MSDSSINNITVTGFQKHKKGHFLFNLDIKGHTRLLIPKYGKIITYSVTARYSHLKKMSEELGIELNHYAVKIHKKIPKFPKKGSFHLKTCKFLTKRTNELQAYFDQLFVNFEDKISYSQILNKFLAPSQIDIQIVGSEGEDNYKLLNSIIRQAYMGRSISGSSHGSSMSREDTGSSSSHSPHAPFKFVLDVDPGSGGSPQTMIRPNADVGVITYPDIIDPSLISSFGYSQTSPPRLPKKSSKEQKSPELLPSQGSKSRLEAQVTYPPRIIGANRNWRKPRSNLGSDDYDSYIPFDFLYKKRVYRVDIENIDNQSKTQRPFQNWLHQQTLLILTFNLADQFSYEQIKQLMLNLKLFKLENPTKPPCFILIGVGLPTIGQKVIQEKWVRDDLELLFGSAHPYIYKIFTPGKDDPAVLSIIEDILETYIQILDNIYE